MKVRLKLLVIIASNIFLAAMLWQSGYGYWALGILPSIIGFFFLSTNLTNRYNFRQSLELKEIKPESDGQSVHLLRQEQSLAEQLGFVKIDEFYLPTNIVMFIFAYYHENAPTTLCHVQYKANGKITSIIDLVVCFLNYLTD